jgi:hypothetical protein
MEETRARTYLERVHRRVVVDGVEERGVQQHLNLRVAGEVLETMPPAADRDPLPAVDRTLDSANGIGGFPDQRHIVGCGHVTLVVAGAECGVPDVTGADDIGHGRSGRPARSVCRNSSEPRKRNRGYRTRSAEQTPTTDRARQALRHHAPPATDRNGSDSDEP